MIAQGPRSHLVARVWAGPKTPEIPDPSRVGLREKPEKTPRELGLGQQAGITGVTG